jgi:succinyl-CoA synthetase beta subunit
VLTRAYEHLDLAWWKFFAELDVPFVLSYRNALRALKSLSGWLATRSVPVELPGAVPETAGAVSEADTALGPDATRDWLEAAGVPYVRSRTVDDAPQAKAAAEELGWPVVLKAVAPGLVHKTEAGGVVLDLGDGAAVEAAVKAMAVSVPAATGLAPESVRYEVQQMVGDGVEMIVGAVPDPTWGPVLMVGAGGIHAETTGDVVWDLPPLSPARAGELLRRLRIWPVLDGARNQRRADVGALTRLVVAFGKAVAEAGDSLGAVDLNPVLVGGEGAGVHAVDAAILRVDPSHNDEE